MKKYLMIGFAAVAFAACSNHDFETMTQAQIDKANYDAKFVAAFGQPASNQDWGFGASTRAFTRATGAFADYVGNYSDANNWTRDGFQAPDPLEDGQKLRVQYYFQMNHIENPNQPDNGIKDFFMQQVYDGGDDPMAGKSPEQYTSAANVTVISGEQMNKLTAGPGHLHVYNFNNGNCGTYKNVANWDQTNVNDKTQQHEDQIELMLNTPTSCFGYQNSTSNTFYDDQWTLVAGSVIDAFCNNAENGYEAWRLANHSDIEDKAVVDKWNRSFIGFDFKLTCDVDPYAKENNVIKTVKYSDAGSSFYFWDDATQTGCKYAYNGTEFVSYTDESAEILIDNAAISIYNVSTNMYGADVLGMDNTDNHNELTMVAAYDPNGTNDNSLYLNYAVDNRTDHWVLNLKFIEKMIGQGYYPVDTKQLKLWAKANDLTDGYYSDWIVSFMPATQGPGLPEEEEEEFPETYTLRVMAEDLTVSSNSDFDFNDVVFDAKIDTEKGKTFIKLLAAGGTLPLKIGCNAAGEGGVEVHDKFEVSQSTMVNTATGKHAEKAPVQFSLAQTWSSIGQIPVYVFKNGEWQEITAYTGMPASKFGCPVGTDWADERQDIDKKWDGAFTIWVGDVTKPFWADWNKTQE